LTVEFIDTADSTVILKSLTVSTGIEEVERQEREHAKYDGWFITIAEAEAKRMNGKAWAL
jgi:hypothetical protein